MKQFLIILALVAVVAFGYYALSGDDAQQPTDDGAQRPSYVAADWQQFRADPIGVSMYVPGTATTSTERHLAKVQVIGPESQPNTEITDGFTFYAGRLNIPANLTLDRLAQREFERDIQGPTTDAVTAPSATTTPAGEMYTYTTRGPSGAASQHALWQQGSSTALITTAIVADPQDSGYAQDISTIQRSLEAVPIDGGSGRVTIQERFDGKLVYTTDTGTSTQPYAAHCQALGGTFSECGNVCGPDAQACASVCALTCNLAPRQ